MLKQHKLSIIQTVLMEIIEIDLYPISDLLLYEQNGDYFRYLNYRTIFIVNIEQSTFYVQNIQRVRVA
jgi:hypothetical protein